jgi:hypothetical protein
MNNVATAVVKSKNGVMGFSLFLNGSEYGHYPCDDGRFQESMTAAFSDAANYGFAQIVFIDG